MMPWWSWPSHSMIMTGWINSLTIAAEANPDASLYILDTSLGGEPYLEIRADGLDARGFAAGELPLDLFLERLDITDNRPLANRVNLALAALGLDVNEVSQFRDTLTVEYYPAPKESQAELMEEWWTIFVAVTEENPTVDTIQIRALMPDTSIFVVKGDVEDVQAFVETEITAVQYLAGLEIEEIPAEGGE